MLTESYANSAFVRLADVHDAEIVVEGVDATLIPNVAVPFPLANADTSRAVQSTRSRLQNSPYTFIIMGEL
jgi:hypothetical protein